MKICKEKDCNKKPNFNLQGSKIGIYCLKHKKENMIDITRKKCLHDMCYVIPVYNLPNNKTGIYCNEHKKNDMINVLANKCLYKNCNTQPLFNLSNEKNGIYCNEHKKENMVRINKILCLEENCTKTPSFNIINSKKGIYCSEHKKENMININETRKCLEEKCNIGATYGYINNTRKRLYCSEHKKENMVNLVSKMCLEENCNKQPLFNIPNEIKGIYCSEHKNDDMIDIINKKCIEEKCNKIPSFNLPNEKQRIYCGEHKKENMINLREDRKCLEEKCNIGATYGYINNKRKRLYCSEHKKENMVNIISKMCLEENCNTQPHFNIPNEKCGIYCSNHKKKNMVNVIDKMCLECKNTYANKNKKYKEYCLRCFIHKFPDVKISRNYKIKENHMTDFLKCEFKDEIMIFDKQTGGCSKRRPDCYIDKFTHIIIIECDENQHRDTSCENKRTMELFHDFGNRPIVFIRFNPDKYINENSEKIPSGFKMHKTLDVPVIREPKEWQARLDLLKEYTNKHLITIPEKEVTNEYLFYDK